MPLSISINIYGEVEATDLATIAALVRQPVEHANTRGLTAVEAAEDKPAKAAPAKAEPKKVEPKAEAPKEEPAPVEPTEDRTALLKSLAMKFAQANGREALVSLFAEYGATNPSTVPADQLDAVIARLQE